MKKRIRVLWLAACIAVVVTPHLSAEITLMSRLSDARAYANGNHTIVSPPPQTQTDFLPAQLSNSANSHPPEGGAAYSSSTSNSSIALDNSMGTLRVTGDGRAYAESFSIAEALSSAKLIELNFTLTELAYSYSITGDLEAGRCFFNGCGVATAKLIANGATTIFSVSAPANGEATLFESGTLPPGDYTLSIEVSAPVFGGSFPGNQSINTADFNFALDPGPTPMPISISGNILYCSNPTPVLVPNVMLTLTGSASDSTLSDGSGNYTFASLTAGGSYTVTPTKNALVSGTTGITTVDVIAVQRHYLNITLLPSGCRLTAADTNGDSAINTVDVIAIQRFFLGLSTGVANVGKYQFTPASRSYPNLAGDQANQNYDTLVFGDVASPFVTP